MKNKYLLSIGLLSALVLFSCKKEESKPISITPIVEEPIIEEEEVTADESLNISCEITCYGHNIIKLHSFAYGSYTITDKGICYGTSPTPTTSDITQSSSTEYFTINNLIPSTTYYIRQYAINEFGTFYSNEVSTTTNINPPTLSIGDMYQGGMIASLNCDGTHGLIVSTYHNQTTYTHVQSVIECDTYTSGGYDDWFLPSKYSMQTIYTNLYTTGLLTNFGSGSTIYNSYWTNTPAGGNNFEDFFYYFSFANGMNTDTEFYEMYSRPVRSF